MMCVIAAHKITEYIVALFEATGPHWALPRLTLLLDNGRAAF